MKIVIDIPKEMILSLEQGSFGAKYNIYDLVKCLMNGTPLPKGHGRLIDADELFEKTGRISPNSQRQHDDIGLFMYMITNSSTIIEADKEE